MLTQYINAAMSKAHYEILADGEGYYGKTENLHGVWANAETLESCRKELQEVLEAWVLLGLKQNHHIPPVNNIDLHLS